MCVFKCTVAPHRSVAGGLATITCPKDIIKQSDTVYGMYVCVCVCVCVCVFVYVCVSVCVCVC